MPNKPTLNQLFEGLSGRLECDLGITRASIKHAGTMGAVSEDQWINMLREHLPERYTVNGAFVIDANGSCSDQIDVVVHDRHYSPFVLNLGGALFVPAESVYAAIEVKQTINAEHVAYAGRKIGSVRKLHRTSIPIESAGGTLPAKTPHNILGGLVSLDSEWNPAFGSPFNKAISALPEHERLDIGCAVQHGAFNITYQPNESPNINAWTSSASLASFVLWFIARLQSVATVPCIDILAYAANINMDAMEKRS